MSAFSNASEVEKQAIRELYPWLLHTCEKAQQIGLEKERLGLFVQTVWGDFLATKKGKNYSIELKAEETDKYSNFFLEMFSNMEFGTPGWMLTSHADYLFYFFLETGELYVMKLANLRKWAFFVDDNGHQRLDGYALRRQKKRDQLNDSWGRCVPIAHVLASITVQVIRRSDRDALMDKSKPEHEIEHDYKAIPW